MLNGRIYRAAFLPLLLALAIAGFSLAPRPAPLGAALAPDAFDGPRTLAELNSLAAAYPDLRPGSPGDQALAAHVARELRGLGATSRGGFTVSSHSFSAQTIEGSRTLTTVLAQRPGNSGEPPIAILAHRDSGGRVGSDSAELSATAVLLELARVFAASETHRGIVLVSTSGGSGGNAGARDFAEHASQWLGGPLDGAIVLGDLTGAATRPPLVTSFSGTPGSAPQMLTRTLAQAVAQQTGFAPAAPTLLDTLAQLAFPLVAGEQGPLNAHGARAVLLQGPGGQAGGELPPPPGGPLDAARLEGLGRAALAAVYALDAGPEVSGASGAGETSLPIQHKLLPEWAVRLLVFALFLPALLTIGDGLARLRRRRRASGAAAGQSLASAVAWVAACGLPFLVCALFATLLGGLHALPAPYPPVAPAAAPLQGAALEAVLACALVLVLAWLIWPALLHRLGLSVRPGAIRAAAATAPATAGGDSADAAPLALLLVLGALAVVVWARDPYTALLLVPALHLWLPLADPEGPVRARSPFAPLALVLLGAAPLALLIAFYAARLGLGFGAVAHTAVLLFAGGRIGFAGAVLWSLALGTLAAALMLTLGPRRAPLARPPERGEELPEHEPLTIRGPMSYAGPGSLGGTESALRR